MNLGNEATPKLKKVAQTLDPKYKKHIYYAVTIQPEDKLQFNGNDPSAKIMKSRQHFYSLYQGVNYPYYLVQEISEPIGSLSNSHIGGRLHYHGIIKMTCKTDIMNLLLRDQYKICRQSRLEISEIHDKESWWKYIHKQSLIPNDIRILSNWEPKDFKKDYFKDEKVSGK